MSSPRAYATELAKLLNSAAQPLYILDEDLAIVFLNRSCQEWLGAAAEDLLGRRCQYRSSAEAGPDAVAAGLCPPPRVLAGEICTATVCCPAEDGSIQERRARFLPLGSGGESLLAVVAILDPVEEPSSATGDMAAAAASEAGPLALHEHIRRFRQEAAARFRADRLIGEGPAMRLARRQVELAATSRSSVLLVGPPGSGRQHLASAIHYGASLPQLEETNVDCRSAKGDIPTVTDSSVFGSLVPLDCSLLAADLLDVASAAMSRAAARGDQGLRGTLLLHRVDEISADVQVQLAEFLSRQASRWRLIATAAEPLGELARRGKFRADLAALLSTLVIELPPLVQRRDDLPLLAQLFLEECNAAAAKQVGCFSQAAINLLDAYAWPGNLDELSQVVSESHQRAAGREIGVADLPERLRVSAQAAAHPRRVEETIVLDEYLGRVERELIRRALARAKGNKARAARLLGVTRPRLYRRMVQLGLE
jgi:DNA-binding NtrC family response regulator